MRKSKFDQNMESSGPNQNILHTSQLCNPCIQLVNSSHSAHTIIFHQQTTLPQYESNHSNISHIHKKHRVNTHTSIHITMKQDPSINSSKKNIILPELKYYYRVIK